MMVRLATCAVTAWLLVLGTLPVSAQTLTEAEAREGFIALINGRDFSGWRFSGNVPNPDKSAKPKPFGTAIDLIPPNWKAGDGMIQLLKGGSPNLASQWDFDDFEVRLQWKAHKKSYNSGFYVRSGKAVGANQINLNAPAVGELINTVPALKEKGKGVPQLHKEGGNGEWNDWRVVCQGSKITFWVNGTQAWEVEEFVPARGYLGLQAEGTIDFRNLRIKETGYQVLRNPAELGGTGWNVKDDIMSGATQLTTPKSYKNYTLRIEFRGNGHLKLGTTSLLFQQPDLEARKHPADQFNYLQVSVNNGKAKVWFNTEDLKLELPVGDGPIAIVPEKSLDVRNLRIREMP